MTSFKDTVNSHGQMMIPDICDMTGHSYRTVQCLLTEELNMTKKCEMDTLVTH